VGQDIVNFGLSEKELAVFHAACEYAVSFGSALMYMADIWKKLQTKGFSENDIHHSLESLHQLGFINKSMSYSDNKFFYVFFITSAGFEKYLQKNHPDFSVTFNEVAQYINSTYEAGQHELLKSEHIAATFKQSKMMINHILEKLHNQGKIKLIQAERGNWVVNKVIPA
jgi:predicted transcriptional regulator